MRILNNTASPALLKNGQFFFVLLKTARSPTNHYNAYHNFVLRSMSNVRARGDVDPGADFDGPPRASRVELLWIKTSDKP